MNGFYRHRQILEFFSKNSPKILRLAHVQEVYHLNRLFKLVLSSRDPRITYLLALGGPTGPSGPGSLLSRAFALAMWTTLCGAIENIRSALGRALEPLLKISSKRLVVWDLIFSIISRIDFSEQNFVHALRHRKIYIFCRSFIIGYNLQVSIYSLFQNIGFPKALLIGYGTY